MNPLCVLLGSLIRLPNCQLPQSGPQILTSHGAIEGTAFPGVDGSSIRVFRGIPYARVENRGQPSQRLTPWMDVRNAVRQPAPCPAGSNTATKEDCLFLNVFLPTIRKNTTSFLPTLVVLLSEELVPPSPSSPAPSVFLASALVPQTIALITVQYRSGVFGFLNSDSANAGLFDVINAFRFIFDNVTPFGLDPMRITLAGVGDGAQVASILSLSPAIKSQLAGLILLSGSSWSIGGAPDPTEEFFSRLDCGNQTEGDCFNGLKLEIVEAAADGLRFHPIIGDMLVPSEPSVLLDSYYKLPTLISLSDYPVLEVTENEFNNYIALLGKRFEDSQRAKEKIRTFYYPLESDLIEEQFADLKSDITYRIPAIREATARAQYAPVYMAKFDEENELMLLLETGENKQKKLLVESIVNFVKTGNPSTVALSWPSFGNKGEYLRIGNETFIDRDLLKEELIFWEELSKETKKDFFTGEEVSLAVSSLSVVIFMTIILICL